MSRFKALQSSCKNMGICYFSDNSVLSRDIIKLLKIDFTNINTFKTQELSSAHISSCKLLIYDMNINTDSIKIRKKIKELSNNILILLSLSPNSDLSLYDELKQEYEIYSFDKSNLNASSNTIFNAVKHIQKQSTINSLENKVTEFKKILELYDEHIIASISDKDGYIKYATKAFSTISGYSNEELVGQKHNIVRHPDQNSNTFKDLWQTITLGKTWKGEIKNKKKNGSFYWVYATISPEFDDCDNIIGYSAIRQDISEKKYIEYLSITDSLTKLYNRRHFDTVFERELKNSKRHKYNLSFLLIDIDFFKQYNDTYGHQEGDLVLKRVSLCIKNSFKRPDDYVFRVGGEEFAVIYNVEEKEDSIILAKQLIKNISDLKIEHKKSMIKKVITISAGLSFINNNIDTSTNYLYKITDNLLYNAKNSGRNQIQTKELK